VYVCLCVCISLGGEGNALHPVLSSLLCVLLLYFTTRLDYRNECVIEMRLSTPLLLSAADVNAGSNSHDVSETSME